jgi:coproporphyrinogen III oxidase
MEFKEIISNELKALQDRICRALSAEDGAEFEEDNWQHSPESNLSEGGGRTRVIQGNAIEKGGVNFSGVGGKLPPRLAETLRIEGKGNTFYATGVSIVLHPHNPNAPIIHMNVRYFELDNGTYWFGGGIDLTPHYIDFEDGVYFHQQLKEVCDRFDTTYYPKFKQWADDYFFIEHRKETRGIGGIFFDHLSANTEEGKQQLMAFIIAVGDAFAPIYVHFLQKYKNKPFTEAQKNWQSLRRGRYVEFNLVWDRGTKFGLETGGRTESILMSMPPMAEWKYEYQPEPDSPEAYTQTMLRKGIEWIEMDDKS